MKLLSSFAAGLIMVAMFISCSKDKAQTPTPPAFNIAGLWEGKIGTDAAIPTGYFGIQIKQDGKIDRISADKSVSGTGTWTLDGTSFKAQYTGSNTVTVKITATLDKLLGKLTGGKWENNANNKGTWYATQEDN
jgi:hypothetical protein